MYAKVLIATRFNPEARNGLITLEIEHPEYVHAQTIRTSYLAPNYISHRTKAFTSGVEFYVPDTFFGKGKGMQPGMPLEPTVQGYALETWLEACKVSYQYAKRLDNAGVAYEQAFRLIAPPHEMRGVLTATEHAWQHFIQLRTHTGADYAMRTWAYMVKEAIDTVEWQYGDVHLPFYTPELANMPVHQQIKICAARVARISYGEPGAHDNDLRLAESMIKRAEWSPFEQCAVKEYNHFAGVSRLNSTEHDEDMHGFVWQSGRNIVGWRA